MGSSSKDKEKKGKEKKEKKEKSSSKEKKDTDAPSPPSAPGGSISCEAASAATAAAAAAGVAAGLAAANAAQAERAQAEAERAQAEAERAQAGSQRAHSEEAPAVAPPPSLPPPPPPPQLPGQPYGSHPYNSGGYSARMLGGVNMPPMRLSDESLYTDYRRCMGALERVINGDLAAKRAALAEAARRIEDNMEEVNQAASLVRAEMDADYASVNERLEAATRVKLAMLSQQLSSVVLDLEAVDSFIADVASIGNSALRAQETLPTLAPSASPSFGATAVPSMATQAGPMSADATAASAFALLQRQPELMARASRLASKRVLQPEPVASNDLPRETAERNARLQRAEALEQLVRVKDSMLWSALGDVKAKDEEVGATAAQLSEVRAMAEAMREASREEIMHWAEVADAYQGELRAAEDKVTSTTNELAEVRSQLHSLSAHNAELRQHLAHANALLSELSTARATADAARAQADRLAAHNEALVAHAEQLRQHLAAVARQAGAGQEDDHVAETSAAGATAGSGSLADADFTNSFGQRGQSTFGSWGHRVVTSVGLNDSLD